MIRNCVISVLLMAVPGLAAALGLGSIELHSGLNQPFDARINLVSPTAGEIQSLKVQLADSDAFERAGVDRPFVLSRLQFDVVSTDSGPDYIHITTREPVREPFLDFLVEAAWSNGRLFREYTVLLDPPMYNPDARQIAPGGEQAAPAAAAPPPPAQQPSRQPMAEQPGGGEAKPAPAPAESAKPAAPAEAPAPAPSPAYGGNTYGPVVTGNTLWSIARETRPDTSISIQQMMLALQRSNPEAFISSNINGLKRGYVLHMPDRQDIESLDKQEALAQVRKEYARWDELKGRMAETAGERPAGGAAPAPEQPAAGAAKGKPELKIVTPEKGAGAGQTEAGGGAAETGKTGNSLAMANEQLQSLQAENADLKEQQSEDAAVVADLQRLIKLKNDELAKLQQSLQNMNAQAAKPAAPPPARPKPAPAKPKAAAPPAPAPMSLTARIMSAIADNVTMIAGALGALVIAILILVAIRRRAASRAEEQALAPDVEAGSEAETEMPSDSEAETEFNPDTAEEPEDEEQLGESTMEDHTVIAAAVGEEAAAGPAVQPEEDEAEEPEQEEEEDPLAEVNVFLAYEHFDQAEEFVRDAISREPENLDFHSKLLEVFYAAGDKAKYEEEARVLNEKVNGQGPHWDMAEVMWQEMSPNRALFEEPAEGEEDEKADTTGGGIVDLTADEQGGEADTGLDFDLGDLSAGGGEEKIADTEQELLDITTGHEDESTLDITTSAAGDDEDILDVTAAVGLGGEDETAGGEDEEMLDLTGGVDSHEGDTIKISAGGGEDLLDVTAHADLESDSIDEDLLDLTAATSAGADSEELLEVGKEDAGTDDQGENSLDFDLTGLAPEGDESEEQSSAGDTLDIDLDSLGSESEEEDGGRDNVIDFGGSSGGDENEGGIELDLGGGDEGEQPESSAADSGLDMELTLDEDDSADLGGLSLDMEEDGSDDGGADQGLEVDFGGEEDSGGAAEEKDAGSDFSIDLDIQDDEPAGEADSSLDMEKTLDISLDEDEDAGDATMFVPRSSDAQEQSPEDEIATKLDLAKAYVELGDGDSAKSILEEIIADGNADQQQQARELLNQVSS